MNNTKNRRRTWLIDPQFQLSYLRYTVGIALAVGAIFFGATRLFFWQLQERGMRVGLTPDHIFFRFINDQKHQLDWVLAGAMAVITVFLSIFGLYMSNKIAGPVRRIRSDLDKRASGHGPETFKVRDKDYFQDLPRALNDYIASEKKRSGKKAS